jgi:hypothetical protein
MLDDARTDNAANQRCRSCHAEGRVAANKAPTAAKHPHHVVAWTAALQRELLGRPVPEMPVYDKNGKQAASGVIVCSTCHNPHQWDPEQAEEGPGENIEGDVRTSFLRASKTARFLCSACHGRDSLFRFKYFHSDAAHQKHALSH